MVPTKSTILIVDKKNTYAQALGRHLIHHASIVVVSRELVEQENGTIAVPYTLPIPQIPEGAYSTIIFVWDEKEAHLLEPLSQKAQASGGNCVVLCTDEELGKVREVVERIGVPIAMLVVGDVFGTGESVLDKYLQKAKNTRHMSLPHMGLHMWYPVLFADVVERIVDCIHAKREGSFFIGPSHQVTSISLFHGIQTIEPELAIDFSDEKEAQIEKERHPQSIFNQYDSIKKLQGYYRTLHRKRENTKSVGTVVFAKPVKKISRRRGWMVYMLYLLLLFVSLPILVAVATGGIGTFLLYQSAQGLRQGNFALGLQEAVSAEQNYTLSQTSLDLAKKEFSLVGQEKSLVMLGSELTIGIQASRAMQNALTAAESLGNILRGKTLAPKDDADRAVGSLKNLSLQLGEIPTKALPEQYQKSVVLLQSLNVQLAGTIDELPQVLGISGERIYLVLFQNNMELRPGGGFIGSYGLLRLHNGAIKDFSIHDVYDADGQLKGHVEPPFAIRRYVPLVHLYMRDSNFDVDFSQDAKIAAQMLFQETGDRVDGVVGVDLNALKSLLSAVGSVYVPSYNQTITDTNFFTLIESHAEKGFFPGSTQKKDFLRAFAVALQDKIIQKGIISWQNALQGVEDMVLGKHVVVGFSDPLLEESFNAANLSGSLTDKRSAEVGQVNDFLGISEANLGVNKDNAFVVRGLSQQAIIDSLGTLHNTSTLTLTNNSDGSWPGGVYRNYIRFIVPQNATVDSISLNGQKQQIVPAITDPRIYEAKGFIAPRGLEVATEKEAGKTLYGFLVTVPVQKSMTIAVSYSLTKAFNLTQQKQTYDLLLWKQPGVDTYPYAVTITIPQTFNFLTKNAVGQSITFAGNLSGDTRISVSFAAK